MEGYGMTVHLNPPSIGYRHPEHVGSSPRLDKQGGQTPFNPSSILFQGEGPDKPDAPPPEKKPGWKGWLKAAKAKVTGTVQDLGAKAKQAWEKLDERPQDKPAAATPTPEPPKLPEAKEAPAKDLPVSPSTPIPTLPSTLPPALPGAAEEKSQPPLVGLNPNGAPQREVGVSVPEVAEPENSQPNLSAPVVLPTPRPEAAVPQSVAKDVPSSIPQTLPVEKSPEPPAVVIAPPKSDSPKEIIKADVPTPAAPPPKQTWGAWTRDKIDWAKRKIPGVKGSIDLVESTQKSFAIKGALSSSGLGPQLEKVSGFFRPNMVRQLTQHPCEDSKFYQAFAQDAHQILSLLQQNPDPGFAQVFLKDTIWELLKTTKDLNDWQATSAAILSPLALEKYQQQDDTVPIHQFTQALALPSILEKVLLLKQKHPEQWAAQQLLIQALPEDSRKNGITLGLWIHEVLSENLSKVSEGRWQFWANMILNPALTGSISSVSTGAVAALIQDPEAQQLLKMNLTSGVNTDGITGKPQIPDTEWIKAHQEALAKLKASGSVSSLKGFLVDVLRTHSETLLKHPLEF
jgi:hypothetical protein